MKGVTKEGNVEAGWARVDARRNQTRGNYGACEWAIVCV